VVTVVVDTSVAIKWFHDAGEAEVTEARTLLEARPMRNCSEVDWERPPRLLPSAWG